MMIVDFGSAESSTRGAMSKILGAAQDARRAAESVAPKMARKLNEIAVELDQLGQELRAGAGI